MNTKRTRNSIARPFGVVSILFTNSRMDTVFRRRWHADFCRRERDASFSLSVHRKLQQCRPPFGVGGLFPQNRMVRAIPLHSTAYSKQRHPFRAVRLPVVTPQCRGTHCASAFLLTQKVQLDNRTLHTVSIRTRNAYLRGGTKSTAVLYQKKLPNDSISQNCCLPKAFGNHMGMWRTSGKPLFWENNNAV